jgi:hypothetical protein
MMGNDRPCVKVLKNFFVLFKILFSSLFTRLEYDLSDKELRNRQPAKIQYSVAGLKS